MRSASGSNGTEATSAPLWGRYLLAILLPSLLLIMAFAVTILRLQDDIDFTQSELDGLHDIHGINQSVLMLQQMRGLDQLVIQERMPEFEQRIDWLEQRLNDGMRDWIHESRSRNAEVEQKLRNLNFQLLSRSTLPRDTDAARRFHWFSNHIKTLQQSASHIALASKLMLDPEARSYTLIDILTNSLPSLSESLGRLRGVGSGVVAKGKNNEQERIWLGSRYVEVREHLYELRQHWHMVGDVMPELSTELKDHFAIVMVSAEALVVKFEKELATDSVSHSLAGAMRLFDDASHTIELTEGFYQAIHDALLRLLHSRLEQLYWERLLLLGLGLLALVAILFSTSAYYRGNRRAIESLNQAQNQLEAAQRIAGVGHWNWDLVRRDLEWSAQLYRIFGWQPHSFAPLGERMTAMIHPEDRERVKRLLTEVLRSRAVEYQTEYRIVREDDSIRHVSESGEVLRDASAKPLRMVGTVHDITEQKHAAQQHLLAREQAEQVSRAKGMFLANMSHEIRTPMNAVINLSRLALQTDLTARQYDYIDKVLRAGEGLLGIINDILDYSKIEEGKLTLEQIPFSPETVIEDLTEIVKYRLDEREVEMLVDMPTDLPSVRGDALRLSQVLTNLLSNAIKFTERGEVVLRVLRLVQDDKQIQLRFIVSDTGIGISEEQQQRLFQPFEQADGSTTRRYGGTGLGLAISRRLLQLMGSELTLQSEAGKGAQFSFELQLPLGESAEPEAYEGLRDQRILVVDDNAVARQILTEMLARLGCKSDAVADGESAIELLHKSCTTSTPYHGLLIDWHMPGLDGIETFKRIQSDPHITTKPQAILVTAHGAAELREQAIAQGFSGLLDKPFTPLRLAQVLANSEPQTRSARCSQAELELAFHGRRVLVVEDNEINQTIANELLSHVGLEVIMVDDGKQALQRLERESFDLVLMDLQMPVMDGYEATRQIRAEKKWDNMPVVAMTAHAMKEERDRCLALGMNDHIAKPIDIDELHAALRRWIKPA